MIIRETRILECWCPSCGAGQMGQILQKSFAAKETVQSYVGQRFTCSGCGADNFIEDFISLIPEGFQVMSANDLSKAKSNQDLKTFLDSE